MQKHGMYGYIAGMTSAIILQPLDNIKMVLMMPPKDIKFTNNFIKNGYISTQYLFKDEGFRSFYRGLSPNIIRNGFGSSVYLFSLRFGQRVNKKYQLVNENSFCSNFLFSSFGRIMSAIASNPLNILQTRYQMAGKQRWSGSVFNGLKRLYTAEGIKGCFKGCLTSCYKEGIFAGLFYGMYEEGKKLGIQSSISGIGSGMIATLITHPLEIIRAQLQTSNVYISGSGTVIKSSIREQIIDLAKQGQLLRGVSPRLIKKPLANTITFLIFQKMEKNHVQNN